ncbi:helix-turn-helix transcriptional regulator [Bacillus sp. 165]|uniref:helix-turn-helix domain-containing protein n=1 Tax=Bacillus sp. 165 TaxID=1529117 RepID=UPI001ADB7E79|nr:helix-turn-helix transcriptional regulator [Bacillus sp. 165]MBO9129478.1 helix-turn-helix transcriptional regulator [Bacillus sp. 165]
MSRLNAALFHKIEHYMNEKKWNKVDLSKHSGIHISDISRVFNNKQPLSLKHFDAIIQALGLAEDSLYSFYIEECYNEKQCFDKRRSVQFLHKCMTNGYEKQYQDMLHIMLGETSDTIRSTYLAYIFLLAEKLFTEGKEELALILYDLIIENEQNHFSEQLAISYFRKFYITRLTEKGQDLLTCVLEHLAHMPQEIRKEAYLWITAFYYRGGQWKDVLYYAKRLENMVKEGDYYGRALMYQCFALTRLEGSLEDVLALIKQYEQVNEYFAEMAVGNRYVALLDFGKLEYADEYLVWIANREDMYVGLPRIFDAYVSLNRLEDAKELLHRYAHIIEDMAVSKAWLKQKMHLDFRYVHALYLCKGRQFLEGLNELLELMYTTTLIGNTEMLKKCLLVYWEYKEHATAKQVEKYMELLRTRENNEAYLTGLVL